MLTGDTVDLLDGAPWLGGSRTGHTIELDAVNLTCPVEPSKVIGIGRNYAAHALPTDAGEAATPLFFLKPPSALNASGSPVILPAASSLVYYEGELGFVIGRRAKNVSVQDAASHVFGLTITCDVTARDLQERDEQWTRAKGFDTFCPVSNTIVSGVTAEKLHLTTRVNGQVRQSVALAEMLFSVPQIVSLLSSVMTLEPGDLVLTGTPHGVGAMNDGDLVQITISELGELSFHARSAS